MIRHSVLVTLLCILSLNLASLNLSVLQAADRIEKYTVGENVEVLHFGKWVPATVLEVNRKGEVRASHPFGGSTLSTVFQQAEVRHAYESGAIARGRMWSDATGAFKIKAALLKISNNTLTLRTTEEREVTIELDKLSDVDKKFIENFKKQAGIAALPVAELPALVRFSTQRNSEITSSYPKREWGKKAPVAQLRLAADPQRSSLQLMQAGIAFPHNHADGSLQTLIALGGKDSWLLAALGADERPVRLLWGALAQSKLSKIQLIPPGEVVQDYHAPSMQLLTSSIRDSQTVLTLWKVSPSAEEAQAVVSWIAKLDNDSRGGHAEVWARFASDKVIIQRDSSHRVIAWDVADRKVAWSTVQQSFFAPSLALSPNGKHLFIPEDEGLRIVEPLTGQVTGIVPTSDSCSSVAPHYNGELVAILSRNELLIVDITGKQPQRNLDASTVGTPFSTKMHWLNDSLIAFEPSYRTLMIFSLDLQLPGWKYDFDSDAYDANARSGRTRSLVDGHLVYAASFGSGINRGLALGAVEIPQPDVVDKIKNIRREELMILHPGKSVRIDASKTDNPARVQAVLEGKAAANGWIVSPVSNAVLVATMGRGPTQTVQYEMSSVRGGGGTNIQSASVTPYISTLNIVIDGVSAWSTSSSSGVPPTVMLKENETLQGEVDRNQRPDIEFFDRVVPPNQIIDPKKKEGIGMSMVTNRGLQ